MKIKKKLKLELFFQTRHMLYCITYKQLYRLVKKKRKKKREKQQQILLQSSKAVGEIVCLIDHNVGHFT